MLSIIIILVLLGVGLYLISTIPMDPAIHTIIRCVAILVVVLWIIKELGLFSGHLHL